MDIAFVGDRGGRRFPTAYTLPKETPWQWKQYKFGNNLMELKTHYEKEDVGRTLWTPGRDATTVNKKLPKMIQIPSEWVQWLREKPRTGYEFAAEITRRIGLGTTDNPCSQRTKPSYGSNEAVRRHRKGAKVATAFLRSNWAR